MSGQLEFLYLPYTLYPIPIALFMDRRDIKKTSPWFILLFPIAIPAMIVLDSVTRLLPGVLGNKESSKDESHSQEGYLEYPQYTKPENFQKWKVPKILLSGNHGEIEKWRKKNSKILGAKLPKK